MQHHFNLYSHKTGEFMQTIKGNDAYEAWRKEHRVPTLITSSQKCGDDKIIHRVEVY